VKLRAKNLVMLACFVGATIVGDVCLDLNIRMVASPFEHAVAAFYTPGWISAISLFGGIHGAPSWSVPISVVLGGAIQNAVIVFVLRSLLRRIEKMASIK
jgi:hypothetical protein